MTEGNITSQPPEEGKPRWQPLSAIDRRILGVLAEKAKTTPDNYPLSANAICTGCNQKSNRAPVMQLEVDDVEEAVDRLRQLGALGMVEGYGRVTKYRHYLYEWLGVDKVELAVVAELLLRGSQTEGELRGRAARMEPIADLGALRPVLESLKAKGLVIPLNRPGRGHVVTHALYEPREFERVKKEYGSIAPVEKAPATPSGERSQPASAPVGVSTRESAPSPSAQQPTQQARVSETAEREIAELRTQLAQLRSDFDELCQRQDQTEQELRDLKDALGA